PITTSKKQISPIFEEIILIKSHINENNGNNEIKITQIVPTELINNARPKANDQYGNVLKRLWQTSGKHVACKRFDTQQTQKFQDQLVLLKKLNNCSSIIKFHGLSTLEWGSGQSLRPGLYQMFLKLEELRAENPKDKTITTLNPKKYDDNDEVISVFTEDETQIAD
ncbi:14124_t:CDS:2, partial [Racocetra fulgida]